MPQESSTISLTANKRRNFLVKLTIACICCFIATLFGLRLYKAHNASLSESSDERRGIAKARYAIRVSDALNADNSSNYQRATFPAHIKFPEDHGLHPDFKTEWWYFTGNLQTPSGREFAYQLTFIRSAIAPSAISPANENKANDAEPPSDWGTRQIFMGHFAISDKERGLFFHSERFSRMNQNLAGCELSFDLNAQNVETKGATAVQAFKVWLYDWRVQTESEQGKLCPTSPNKTKNPHLQDALFSPEQRSTIFPLRLRATLSPEEANGKEVELTLIIDSLKPVVLQGDNGYSPKSMSGANASYYYSLTRLTTRGNIRIGGETFGVEGLSWLDREWSTSALEKNQTGWDWFSLHLDDGRDLMFYRLRQKGENNVIFADSASAGVIVEKDGSTRALRFHEVQLTPQTFWQSPVSHIASHQSSKRFPVYPSVWRFSVPSQNVELTLTPLLPHQELLTSVRYWEGAVTVRGKQNNKSMTGKGYVEMTGYSDE